MYTQSELNRDFQLDPGLNYPAKLSEEEKAQAARSALAERAKAKQQAEKNMTNRMNEINNR